MLVLQLQMHPRLEGAPPSAQHQVCPEARHATCLPLAAHHAPHCPGSALLAVVQGCHTQVVCQHRQRQHSADVVQEGQGACQALQDTRPGQGRCTAAEKVELRAASPLVAWEQRLMQEPSLQHSGALKGHGRTYASQVPAGSGRCRGCWAAEQQQTGGLLVFNPSLHIGQH